MNAIDTNVLVYSIDNDEPVKQNQAIELLDHLVNQETTIVWQVAGEFLSCLRKWHSKKIVSLEEVNLYMNNLLSLFPIILPSSSVLDISMQLSSRYSLSHWDSMLIAACIDAGVDTLYTEDLNKDTQYDLVKIINPFL